MSTSGKLMPEISLRDYFAAQAMRIKFGPRGTTMELPKMAAFCYQMADAMLAARDVAAPQSAPKAADDEPLFTASMYGTAAAADKAREEWLATKVEPQWQPIETAPKSVANGRKIEPVYLLGFGHSDEDKEAGLSANACVDIIWWEPLLRDRNGKRGKWVANAFGEAVEVHPTHWQPLPAPPEQRARSLAQAEQAAKKCQCAACASTPHASDCSVHNEPAYPNGPCDCGAEQAAKEST